MKPKDKPTGGLQYKISSSLPSGYSIPGTGSNPKPDNTKLQTLNIDGRPDQALLQFTEGGVGMTSDGKNIFASINKNTVDGSDNSYGSFRQRNEIAIKNLLSGPNAVKTIF